MKTTEESKVLLGMSGWLFLTRDRNDVCGQHRGEVSISADEKRGWIRQSIQRSSGCRELGAEFWTLVAPDKHAVYSEYLPFKSVPFEKRPIFQVSREMNANGLNFLYPLKALLDKKKTGEVFSMRDTHWNAYGASIAFEELRKKSCLANRVGSICPLFKEVRSFGDLGIKLNCSQRCMEKVLVKEFSPEYSNGIKYTGRIAVYKGHGSGVCLVFGNSFFDDSMAFLLSNAFEKIVFVFSNNFDFSLVRELEPAFVLYITCERFVPRSPRDAEGLSGREQGALVWMSGGVRRTADLRNAIEEFARSGFGDAAAQLACFYAAQGNLTEGRMWLEAAGSDKDHYLFPWSLALGLAGRLGESMEFLAQATMNHPRKSYFKKYVSFMVDCKKFDLLRSLPCEDSIRGIT